MIAQASLTVEQENTTLQEAKYTDACINHPCYQYEKDETFGFCPIRKYQISHVIAQTQRICDEIEKTELQQEIRQWQKSIEQQQKTKDPMQIAKRIIKKDRKILKALNNGKQKPIKKNKAKRRKK